MKIAVLLFALILSGGFANAQITATFDQQGAEELKSAAGKRIKGVGLLAAAVCLAPNAPAVRAVDTEWVYSYASQAGIPRILPAEAVVMLTQSAARSPYNIGLEVTMDVGSPIVSTLAAARKIGSGWGFVGLAPLAITLVKNAFSRFAPDNSVILAKLLQGSVTLVPGACIPGGATVLYHYMGAWPNGGTKSIVIP